MSYFPPKFHQNVKNAIERVKDILGTTRNPTLASEVDHAYCDKFSLATWATSVTAMGLLNALEPIGLAPEIVEKYREMHENGKTVNMHYEYKTSATFIKKTEKEVDSGRKSVTEKTGGIFGTKTTTTTKVIHTVKEYHWTITSTWKLSLYTGAEIKTDTETVLFNRNGTYDLKVVGTERNPLHGRSRADTLKIPFNWILGLLNGNGNLEFKIDRGKDTCKTPVRNENVEEALKFFASFKKFITTAPSYAMTIGGIEMDQAKDDTFRSLGNGFKDMIEKVSLPVFPFMEKRTANDDDNDDSSSSNSVLMKIEDVHKILAQQKKDLLNIVNETSKLVPSSEDGNLVTEKEVLFLLISMHIQQMCGNHSDTIHYIETMLYDQLKKAVGKEITGKAFDEYMRFHNQKIYREEYLPKPFCYAIRRPDHYPEGVLSIESSTSPTNTAPILTSMRKAQADSVHTMYFSLNAATNVEFNGDRYLHACVNNQFNKRKQSFQIHARARQFSSFVLMIGTIPTAKKFDVNHAIIVKDKDDLIIPLLMETIPTAKEFKEAISSLSPEQQRFANAYRNMQLSSTLFALGVVQIKPQLEKVLNLPHDSLTKEIKLTQSLMDLFIEYQISSDLISYDSKSDGDLTPSRTPTDSGSSTLVALNQVKKHVEKMLNMITELKQEDLKKKTEVKFAEVISSDDEEEESMAHNSYRGARQVDLMADIFSNKKADMLSNSATTFKRSIRKKSAHPMAASMRYADSAPPPPPSSLLRGGGGPPGMRLQRQQQQVATIGASHVPKKQDDVQEDNNNARNKDNEGGDEGFDVDDNIEDYTSIPKLLEKRCAAVDPTAKLRPTILKVGDNWKHKFKKSILSKEATRVMNEQDQSKEKNKAMDLLDALSKSGALSLDTVELHIVVVSTHCFEKTVVDTVIQENENPIEHIERSLLAMSSAMQQVSVGELVKNSEVQRLQDMSPTLFPSLAD